MKPESEKNTQSQEDNICIPKWRDYHSEVCGTCHWHELEHDYCIIRQLAGKSPTDPACEFYL